MPEGMWKAPLRAQRKKDSTFGGSENEAIQNRSGCSWVLDVGNPLGGTRLPTLDMQLTGPDYIGG